jgi:hypothetical protein
MTDSAETDAPRPPVLFSDHYEMNVNIVSVRKYYIIVPIPFLSLTVPIIQRLHTSYALYPARYYPLFHCSPHQASMASARISIYS